MKVPRHAWTLMAAIYTKVLPQVHRQLRGWKQKASAIPNRELRKQALASIESKTFHCEGGAIFSLLSLSRKNEVLRFIVAYQTMSDYLDNLCDRSTSLDPADFRALHESMLHALTPGETPLNYYRYRYEQNDGGYLRELVKTCQSVLAHIPHYEKIAADLRTLASYYCDLQVHKHVRVDERVPRLVRWYEKHKSVLPEMSWYEFSACAGSTLAIFCLVAYAAREHCADDLFSRVTASYFPWVQGLHILLDYFIDQEEDRNGGDLNFCFYYDNEEQLAHRLAHFIKQAHASVANLPHVKFHRMIHDGMLGIYLADRKVQQQKEVQKLAKKILKLGGLTTRFFYMNGWIYRGLKQKTLGKHVKN